MTNKYKLERHKGINMLVIQGQKGQQISEREYYAVSNGQIPGLLRAELIRKGGAFKLNYNISGLISLREFLYNPLRKDSFAKLLENILHNMKALQNAYFNQQYLLLDMNATMVNPTTQEISFVYVPITFYESGTNLKSFLLGIIECCSFVPGEDTAYVREYIRILNNGINFSIFDLEEYIKRLKGRPQTRQSSKKCPKCGFALPSNTNFCPACGMKVNGLVSYNEQGTYDPLQGKVIPEAMQTIDPYTAVVESEKKEHVIFTPPRPMWEQIQDPSVPAAIPVPEPEFIPAQEPVYPQHIPVVQNKVPTVSGSSIPQIPTLLAQLVRNKTGETVAIHSERFRIGKEPNGNDYVISDNSTISRHHAILQRMNGKWYLRDLNSTNKTYVNASAVCANSDVEICTGTNIRFANEDYIFYTY